MPTNRTQRGRLTAESALLERIGLPEEVELFEEFEELAKTYTVEAPFVSRSQIELMFDIYDGRKLSQSGGGGGATNELNLQQSTANGSQEDHHQHQEQHKLSLGASECSASQRARDPVARRSVGGLKAIANRGKRHGRANLTWCKLLFASKQLTKSSSSNRRDETRGGNRFKRFQCCLSKSETGQDLWLSPSSSSATTGWPQNSRTLGLSEEYLSAALELDNEQQQQQQANNADNKEEEAELRAEVLQLIGPLLHRLRRSSTLSLDCGGGQNSACVQEQQQQVILADSAGAAGRISVCLFDMRKRNIRIKLEAENGRRWWRIESILQDLRWRFRTNRKQMEQDPNGLSRYFEQRHLSRARVQSEERWTRSERLGREQFDRLIALAKDSLNHLIDAQLLLRNKLANELQQQRLQQNLQPVHLQAGQQQQCLIARENEYESLLKNNFNLLKVWQNFEETKRLACFVCEPIKANLADLFWFSRQRFALVGCSGSQANDLSSLLSSPLVSLDAIQVKRGLIQILEALHYLHAICKLVHRNVTPSNILIAANNDNWKLSGLQFAIRFESATISESASIMANEGSNMLRYSASGCSQTGRLRRQRTLHQTKCEEFSRKPKCANGILQPEVDYLAPEIWKSSECSHKSDLFSFGLILGQTYDLFRHKSPISCRCNLEAYERELKKLVERRRLKLSRLVPLEMREALLATLECEPNLRPSANYALQLFRRPIELCKANDDSLRHLRRSLRFLDAACPSAVGFSSSSQQQHPSAGQLNNQVVVVTAAAATEPRGRASYFRKVTSASANQAPRARQQSKTLHLLNLLLRGVDSLAQMGLNSATYGAGSDAGSNANLAATSFASLRSQFEFTFESLRQLFGASNNASHPDTWRLCGGSGGNARDSGPIHEDSSTGDSPAELASLFAASKPADQRSLMLVIALHRRLLDQLARMRAELPPVCRLAAANSALNRPTPRHRALAEMEDKLHSLVSRDSLRKLAPVLTDPLLKLDEFLLLYELMGDLFAFVGQKCRQNFLQRGKQLLNELTPVTGCPSSSSSDDDDDYNNNYYNYNECSGENSNNFVSSEQFQQQQQFDTCAQARSGASRETLNNLPLISPTSLHHQDHYQLAAAAASSSKSGKMSHSGSNSSSTRRFSEYPEQTNSDHRNQHRASAGDFLLQQPKLPTRISITAPSPMGSMRDINNHHHHHQQQQQQQQQHYNANRNNINRYQTADLCDRTSELNLRSGAELNTEQVKEELQDGQEEDVDESQERSRSASDQGVDKIGDKSRSQLIDELLRTINDDSFTADYVDLNGKFHQGQHRAATATSSAVAAPIHHNHSTNRQSASQFANMNRPKSAMDGTSSSSSGFTSATNQQRRQSNRPQNTSAAFNSNNQRSSATPTSTFDNVIRRMSTNLVQNFTNKMSSSTQQASTMSDQQQQQHDMTTITTTSTSTGTISATATMTNVRREKSSNYCANSLYVDNQVPARRHSDNTINIPRIQVALSSPQAGNSRLGLNQRASVSASKLANKWKLSAKTNQREASDKLSPNLGGALGYMRRHSSGNTTGNDQGQSNGQTSSSNLLLNASPFKTKSSSNLGLDFLLSNRSMKRRYSAASMLGHQTQRKAENLIDAGMKSVQNMFG